MVKPKLISDPSQVTSEWLTDVLRYSGTLTDGEVVSFVTTSITGTGLMSRVFRFELTYSKPDPNYPQTVVAKFPSLDEYSLGLAAAQNFYTFEVNFYNEIKPVVGIKTCNAYFADIDPNDNTKFVIVMENMVPPYSMGDQDVGCTVEEADVALRELARLHGPLWGDPRLKNMTWMRKKVAPDVLKFEESLYQSYLPPFLERFSGRLDSASIDLLERLGKSYSKVFVSDTPQTVIHGDFRFDNFLIKKIEGGVDVAIVDWQIMQLGHGACDVAYFIGSSLTGTVRKEHEQTLLKTYYNELCRQGVDNYSFDQFFNDYRRYSLTGIFSAIWGVFAVQQTERSDNMFFNMIAGYISMALDLKVTEII
ncbi:MAG: ecdysteroid 22-kinase family protein [Actinobacteria bacterium]|nr:ecdysteroid 22-kinase family protein [Actinomycetota bacterium]